MALQNFQYQWDDGLIFGAGTDIQIVKEEGLRSIPPVRSADVNKPRMDGSFAGFNFLGERIAVLTLAVTVTKNAPFEDVVASIANTFQPTFDPNALTTLKFLYPGWETPRQVSGRVTNAGFPTDLNYSFHRIDALPIEITCPDPIIYDSVENIVSQTLPRVVSGGTFPVTFPMSFGPTSGGALLCNNKGNYKTMPKFTIKGPVTNPTVTLQSTGEYFTLNTTLSASDQIVIDMAAGTIVLNGTTTRYGVVAPGSTWFSLKPGANSVRVSSTDSAYVDALFTVNYRSAWSWS